MIALLIILGLAGSFYAGARYGRNAEAEAVAVELRARVEYSALVLKIKADTSAVFARIKAAL